MSDQIKIFVGNVPYYCSQEQFEETFKNVDGFVKGDIVTKPKSNVCRGFGFVTIRGSDNAEKLKDRQDISIKSRQLRFTDYILNDSKGAPSEYNVKKKYVFVDGLPNSSKKDYIKDAFKDYTMGRYYVKTDVETGDIKNHGMVELIELEDYKSLLEKGFIKDKKGNTLKLSRWKLRPYKKKTQDVAKYDLYKAFNWRIDR